MLCFMCENLGNVKYFTLDRLQKCRKMLAFRKKKLFKYRDVKLPDNLYDKGYHINCYNRFIVLKSKNRDEFQSMFNDEANQCNTSQEQAETLSQDTPSSSTVNEKCAEIEIEMPRPLEVPVFKTELDENQFETYAIELETREIKQEVEPQYSGVLELPTIENPFASYNMDIGPSYVTPDISKAVILKSILTRKTPIIKDISIDQLAFYPGMNLLRATHGKVPFKSHLDPPVVIMDPKIVKTTSLAVVGACIFCNKRERHIGAQREFPTKSKDRVYERVVFYAEGLNDFEFLEKLKHSKSFPSHALCTTEYRNKYEKLTRKNCDDQDWLVFKNLHAEAFEALCAFIDEKIIDKHKTYFLSDLYERYKALLYEVQDSATPFDFESYSPQNLQEKIINRYFGIVEIKTSKNLKRKIVYKSEIKTNFNSAVVENEDLKYDKLAFELRSVIKSMKRGTSEEGKSDQIPEQLLRFVGSLIQGPDIRKRNSYEDSVKIKSICEGIVSRVTKED